MFLEGQERLMSTIFNKTNQKDFDFLIKNDQLFTESGLPKNIFQTWEDNDFPTGMRKAMQSWQDLNPEWNYFFFTKEDRRAFIQAYFSKEILDAYDDLLPGAYQADLWRYCVLYRYGGIYIDTKFTLHEPIDVWLQSDTNCIFVKDKFKKRAHKAYILQGFIVATAKHRVLKEAIDRSVRNIKNHDYGLDVLSITGPGVMGESVNAILGRPIHNEIMPGVYTIDEDLVFSVIDAPDFKNNITFSLYGHSCCFQMHKDYYKERSIQSNVYQLSRDYGACWFRSKVFKNQKEQIPNKSLFYKKNVKRFWRKHIINYYSSNQIDIARNLFLHVLNSRLWSIKMFISCVNSEVKIFIKSWSLFR